jgi:hypothetical protein
MHVNTTVMQVAVSAQPLVASFFIRQHACAASAAELSMLTPLHIHPTHPVRTIIVARAAYVMHVPLARCKE